MNERIRELARTAGFSPFDSQSELVEKFAELIVRECLEQVRDEVQYEYYWSEYDWKLADAVTKRVLQHFGVK